MKRFFATSALLLVLSQPAMARSTSLSITVDHATPIEFDGAATSVFIANPDIADVQVMSPNRVMIFGKRAGETSFMASDKNGQALAERTIVVSQDMSQLHEELNAAIPGNMIKAKSIPNGIVLTGSAKDATAVADAYKIAMRYLAQGGDIINRIQVSGSNQIQIRVRFAEVQRSVNNTLGFDWQNVANYGGLTVGLATGSIVNGVASAAGTIFNQDGTGLFPRPANPTLSTPNDVLGVSRAGQRLNINGMIDALAQDGMATILAEPNLTAMSGETANFLAGGEFPIPIPQGNNTISITFKTYGISLAFTPTLLSGNRINMHVRPEVSQLTTNGAITIDGISVPALTSRKAETTVEVGSGESFAIAGLMDNTQSQTINKFPVLGDMPILGDLFRSTNFQTGQTELVVIITPYIVKPSDQPMSLPTDHLSPATMAEQVLERRYSSADPDKRPISGDPLAVQAAPVAKVTTLPAQTATGATALQPGHEPHSGSAAPQPAVLTPASDSASPVNVAPIVIHPKGESQSGGLLVE